MHPLLPGIFNDAPYHRSHIRVADVISYRFRIQDSSFIIHHSYDCDTNNHNQHVPSGLSGPVADHYRSCAYSLLRGVHCPLEHTSILSLVIPWSKVVPIID